MAGLGIHHEGAGGDFPMLAEKVGDLLLGEAAVDVSDQDLHGWPE
jgi:hypothetical protein